MAYVPTLVLAFLELRSTDRSETPEYVLVHSTAWANTVSLGGALRPTEPTQRSPKVSEEWSSRPSWKQRHNGQPGFSTSHEPFTTLPPLASWALGVC